MSVQFVNSFHWLDYLIFAATLIVSVGIGVFYAIKGGGQKTTDEFLLGNRDMPVIPTALSLLVSFQSGILILGMSSEMYMKGTNFVWYLVGVCVALPLAATIYQPIFYRLQLTSAYEYLELRFKSKLVRVIGSLLFLSSTLMYMAIVLYAPATALSGVSGFNLELLIVVSGFACTLYTTMGGLKAVVWADAFQAVIMYVGFLAVIIQGTIDVGSPKEVWNRAWEGGRIITDWDPNPFTYMNFWSVVFGTALGWMSVYGTNQTAVQRYTSLSSLKKAQWSLFLVIPGMLSMFPMVVIAGLVMYAYYHECDPLDLKLISNRDQLLPYFTVEVLSHVKGLSGVFLACLYSGTLSTVSSGVNSLAAVIWEDFLKPTYKDRLTDAQAARVNKIIACIFGVLSIGLACLAKFLGGVLQAAMTVLSMLGGPLAGLFLFGMIFPWANEQGALAGVFGSSIVMAWICIGAQIVKPYRKSLPRSLTGCSNLTLFNAGLLVPYNTTFNSSFYASPHNGTSLSYTFEDFQLYSSHFVVNQTQPLEDLELSGFNYVYRFSYKLYGLAAILLVFIIGIPVSLITGRGKLDDSIADLVWPGLRYLCSCCLPTKFSWLLAQSGEEIKKIDSEKAKKARESRKKVQDYSVKVTNMYGEDSEKQKRETQPEMELKQRTSVV